MAQRRRSGRRQRGGPVPPPQEGLDPKLVRRRQPPRGPRTIARGYLVLAGLFLVAVLVGVLVNYWVSVKRPGDQPILQVNDRVFVWREYVSILKSQKLGAEALGGGFNAGVAPYQLMQALAENELVRQAASREGLRADKDAVRAEMISRLVPDSDDSGASPSQIDREFDAALNRHLATTQLSFSQYRDIVHVDLLRNQLRDKLGANISLFAPHAFVNMIRITDLQKADEAQRRLEAGETFSRVARQLSDDADLQAKGGAVGWTPRLVLADFDLLLFGLDVGETSAPFPTDDGWYIVRLVERVGDQARLQAMLLDTGAAARQARDRLDTGARFEDLAAELSIDSDLRDKRGDLGLVSVGDFDGHFDVLTQGLPVGELSDPLSTANGTVYLMVSERTPVRAVSEDDLRVLKTRALETWLRREWDRSNISYCPRDDDCFSNVKVDKALREIGDVSKTKFEQSATATAVARDRGSQPRLFP
ncbi:MAG: peptidylprolyl isomerase [Dehalococcoidia bacterium]